MISFGVNVYGENFINKKLDECASFITHFFFEDAFFESVEIKRYPTITQNAASTATIPNVIATRSQILKEYLTIISQYISTIIAKHMIVITKFLNICIFCLVSIVYYFCFCSH